MDKHVSKSQSLYSVGLITSVIMSIILLIIASYTKMILLNIFVVGILVLGVISHIVYVNHINKALLSLIDMSQSIVEQKKETLHVIDGESYIAVLSSNLHLLNVRSQAMIENLNQEKNKLKDYIEDISHQIKTPLTALCLKEDILLEITEDKQRKLVEQMIIQTEKIQQCIESLLQLAQVESQSLQYQKKEYMFEDLMLSIEENLEPLLQKSNVNLHIEGLDKLVYCDFQWFSEALKNIIKNCVEQKENSTVDITCVDNNLYTEIRIQDYGVGFDKEELSHIFERFYRSEKQKGLKGIGIGLSISKGIIEGHHGSVQALNHNGAVFIVTIPNKTSKNKYTVTKQ